MAVLEDAESSRVAVRFDHGQVVTLAAAEVQAFAGDSDRNGIKALWMEIRAASRVTVVIEELAAEFLQPHCRPPE